MYYVKRKKKRNSYSLSPLFILSLLTLLSAHNSPVVNANQHPIRVLGSLPVLTKTYNTKPLKITFRAITKATIILLKSFFLLFNADMNTSSHPFSVICFACTISIENITITISVLKVRKILHITNNLFSFC